MGKHLQNTDLKTLNGENLIGTGDITTSGVNFYTWYSSGYGQELANLGQLIRPLAENPYQDFFNMTKAGDLFFNDYYGTDYYAPNAEFLIISVHRSPTYSSITVKISLNVTTQTLFSTSGSSLRRVTLYHTINYYKGVYDTSKDSNTSIQHIAQPYL